MLKNLPEEVLNLWSNWEIRGMVLLSKLPEEVLSSWNNWEIRGMVLLSLLLQTILIIFGPLRKTIARVWIRILVWSAYLSADMVATVALGNLAKNQGDSSGDGSKKANNSIQAFWAPFLLLHLGGPDTITAYSIEDNELWLRHLLSLVVQVVVAFYVFSRSWGSGILQFIAIPMFIAGIIKYSERTWVLWSSCSKSLRKNSSLFDFNRSFLRTRSPESDQEREYLRQAYTFFHISKFTMQDLAPSYWALMVSHFRFSKIPADGAFKVVGLELGLIYDMFYTKAPLIYSRSGIILRCISFLLSVTAFIIFQVKIEKHAYSSIDVAITYLLLAASVFLELYAFLCLVFSDWTLIWLLDKGGNALMSEIYYRLRKLTTSKRWSRCISQYNLISSSIRDKQLECLELVGIDEMMRQMHVNRKGLNGGLQEFIFEHLRKKAEKMKENYNFFDKNLRSKIIGQRGDGVLERKRVLGNFKWCTIEVEFSRSILVWHVATKICSFNESLSRDEKDADIVSRSKCLSKYMMYLLVIRPNMLSKGFDDELNTLMSLLSGKAPRYEVESKEFRREWKKGKYSAVEGGRVLARQLLESISGSKKRWEMIEEVWMEMLTHAAAHCPWKEHAHALRRGGELLTHVSFLMLHLGLSEQYEFHPSDESAFSITNKKMPEVPFSDEERDYYNQAIKKYLQGFESSTPDEEELQEATEKNLQVNTNFSRSSLDKVKQLEEIIADKDRELEHKTRDLEQKEQELELFRASLTASTPQQGNDSLPRSLPAQTDNQGTGQSPLKNNEISLCMDEK